MFLRFLLVIIILFSLSSCALTDTASDIYSSLSKKVSSWFSDEGKPQSLSTERILLRTSHGDIPLTVEIADSTKERARGMMFREAVPNGTGMLFVFDDEVNRRFWMKDTLVPLDILYITSKKKVATFIENMLPCDQESAQANACALYDSSYPVMYALELPAGFIAANGIASGDELVREE